MFTFAETLLGFFATQLQETISLAESALSNAQGSGATHTAASVACALLGITDSIDGYKAMPDVHPRTVRRIAAQAHMLLSERKTDFDSNGETPAPTESETALSKQNKFRVVTDSNENTPPELRKLAKASGVPFVTAFLACTYFRNPLERVLNVLQDIADLKTVSQGATNPKALFTWLMRRPSENVKLPVKILEQREQKAQATENQQKKAALTAVDTLVIWLNRTRARVLRFMAGVEMVEIELTQDTSDGFAGDVFRVPISQLRPA